MLTTVERLIDGVVQTLTDAVLPDLATPFARGQLYAAVDVLRNLRDRVAPRADLAEAESDSAAAALERTLAALDARDARDALDALDAPAARDAARTIASRIRAALADVPPTPPPARNVALRATLVLALTTLATLPDDTSRAASTPIAEHLGAQAMRDVAVLKPSLLGEISRG